MAGTPLSAPPELRGKWYLQADKYHKTVKEVCAIFGISRKTYYKWYNRDHGLILPPFRNRPLHPHTKLTPEIRCVVYEIKKKYNYGPLKMKWYLKEHYNLTVSTTIIYRYYKRRHLIRKPQKKTPWYTPMKEPYYATFPGENVQIDVKYVPGAQETWSYQYRFIDTVTNMQYAVEMEHKDAQATICAFKKAEDYFLFPLIGIQTDNGSEFRGKFALYCFIRQITHRFIPKRSAPWNGKVERANRSIDDEYYLNYTRPWHTLVAYTNWYNYERPHGGKNMYGRTPYQKYLSLCQKG